MIDLTKPIKVYKHEADIFRVTPGDMAKHSRMVPLSPTRDEKAFILPVAGFVVGPLEEALSALGPVLDRSARNPNAEDDATIDEYEQSVEAYRRLFEAAPKMLALLKHIYGPGTRKIDFDRIGALIAEIEGAAG